jgi:hypothetical protein
MGRIEELWRRAANLYELLSKEQSHDLPARVAKLLTSYLSQRLAAAQTRMPSPSAATGGSGAAMPGPQSATSGEQGPLLTAPGLSSGRQLPLALVTKGLSSLGSSSYAQAQEQGTLQPTLMYKHSAPGAPLPFLEVAMAAMALEGTPNTAAAGVQQQKQLEDLYTALSRYRSSVEATPEVQQLQEMWQHMVDKPNLEAQVQRWVEVLEGDVLPPNKHTRRRAETSGPTLHLPGLVKAAASNFTNNRIFAQRTAGAARRYQVALLLDVSQSMQGHLLQCGLEALVAAAEALERMGISDFTVLAFGAHPMLIKDAGSPWDGAAHLALLEAVNCHPGVYSSAPSSCIDVDACPHMNIAGPCPLLDHTAVK